MAHRPAAPMSCAAALERMAWLANATLSESEERDLRDHMSHCPACREELRRTRLLAAIFLEHPPPETLSAYAEGTIDVDQESVERHLRLCAACADLAARASESWRLHREAAPDPAPEFRPARRLPRYILWAAGVAALAASGAWLLTWQEWAQDRDVWRQREAALERRLAEAAASTSVREPVPAAPRLNVPVFELLARRAPGSLRAPGPGGAVNELRLGADAAELTFVLLGPRRERLGGGRVEILAGDGMCVWSAEGLLANEEGDFTLTLPIDLLPSERFTIVVHPPRAGDSPVRYDVRRLRSGSP